MVFWQILANSIVSGASYGLVAIGFAVIFNIAKFVNIAHGGLVAWAAYLAFFFAEVVRLNILFSAILTVLAITLLGFLIDRVVWKGFRYRKASSAIMLIASIALLIILNGLILVIFGTETKSFTISDRLPILELGGAVHVTTIQLIIIASAGLLFLAHYLFFKKTKFGRAMRAVMDNKEVAAIVGINPERVYMISSVLAGLTAAIGGILIGIDTNLFPYMGVALIIKGFAASVIGGMGSVYASVAGGFLLGFAENFGIAFLPSGLKDAISFALLFLFLIFKPNGLFGLKERV
jgi:branched-chain amino acid transport system permease protein